jgi:NADH dehydrogenase
MKASSLGKILADRTGVQLDRMGRVMVEPDLSIVGHNNIFVLGDLACYTHQDGKPLPGVAPVAMQQGSYLAKAIQAKLNGTTAAPFQYFDKGSLAVIGRNQAVAQIAGRKLSGIFAWLIWVFVHLAYLVEYDNRALVLFQWGLYYFTRKRGARLITGKSSYGWALVKGKGEDK